MRIIRRYSIALLLIVHFASAGAADDDLGCILDPGGPFYESQSITIPVGSLITGAAAVGAILTTGPTATLTGSALLSLAEIAFIPDIEVEYGRAFSGTVEVKNSCPDNLCEGGNLTMGAMLSLESEAEFVVAGTIPPTRAFFRQGYAVIRNVHDRTVDGPVLTIAGAPFDWDPEKHFMEVEWRVSIPTLSISLAPPLGMGVIEIPVAASGLAASGRTAGRVVASLSCVNADHPVIITLCPRDLAMPVEGATEFSVRAQNPRYENPFLWPEEDRPIFQISSLDDDRIRCEILPDEQRPDTATIRLIATSSLTNLVGKTDSITVSVKGHRESAETVRLHFVANHAPEAQDTHSSLITAAAFQREGCQVAVEMAARDADLPSNFGRELYFVGLRPRVSDVTWNPIFRGPVSSHGDAAVLGEYDLISDPILGECDASGMCTASVLLAETSPNRCPPPPGRYEFPYVVYEKGEGGDYGLSSTGTYTLQLANTPPVAHDDAFTMRTNASGASRSTACNVLTNDRDPDGVGLVAIQVVKGKGPYHGAVKIEDDLTVTYTSNEGHGGADTFTYRVSNVQGASTDNDAYWSNEATVMIATLTPPVALPSKVWGFPDTNWPESPDRWRLDFESISFAVTDLDAAENAAEYEFYVDNDALATDGLVIDAEIALVDEANGRTLGDECSGSQVIMKSKARISGLISGLPEHGEIDLFFPFGVGDPQGSLESTSMLTVTVITTNEPPWGSPFYHLTIPLRFGEPMIYALEPAWYEAGCLSFTDPDGDSLRFSLGRPPRKGTVNLLSAGGGGAYSVTMLYEIDRDEAMLDHTGEEPFVDTFTVVATDPFGATAETVVEITVDVINSDPVCVDDEVTTPMNTAVEFEVLGNDSDIDGDELTVLAVGVAGNGTASSVSDNTIRYVPNNGFYGDDTFTYTAEDGYGGLDEATVTVHVVDTEPPVFVRGPSDVGPLSNIAGTCGAVGKWTTPVSGIDVTDNIGLASLTCTHASGDVFPVGVTTVTYTATDLSGNTTDYTFTVTVVDDERPTIDGMPSDICVEVPLGITERTVSWIEPTASDNCGIDILVGTHTPGAVFPLGVTSVVYTATDIHGNVVTDSLGVTVAEAWQLACADKHVTTSNPSGTTVSFADPVIGGCGVTTTFAPVSGSYFDIGDTDVLCEVTDGVRTETCTFTVTVEFVNHDPVANGDVVDLKDSEIATEIDVLKNDSDADGDELTIIDVSASSPCGEVWIDGDGESVWFIGMYCQPYLGGTATFTYTISDGNGGEDTGTVSVDLPDTGTMPEVAEPPKDGR